MDTYITGITIKTLREKKGLTQTELAEILGVSSKAISKWERGIAMPDSSIMLLLCDILCISVNELLCGERIEMESNQQKNEQLLLDMAKELEKKNKTIWTSMWVLMIVSLTAFFAGTAVVAFLIPEGIWQLVTLLGMCVLFLLPCFYALKLEVSVGAYRCKNCGNEIVPTYKEALMAMHKGTTRYLRCPRCQKRTWCKKVLKK